VLILIFLCEIVGCSFAPDRTDWVVYSRHFDAYAFTMQRLRSWSVEEQDAATVFQPPGGAEEGNITLVVYNPRLTPPLPVDVIYTTLRAIATDSGDVLVQRRDPAPATERYVAFVRDGDWIAEFRCFLDATSDSTFDHMVRSFALISP
jgi:hypothetical protein